MEQVGAGILALRVRFPEAGNTANKHARLDYSDVFASYFSAATVISGARLSFR